ncbi:MAG: hypothetical protein BGO49_07685 [Planctomycetales bacterium 71-10]|nr:MAG: hypothetical protein BGO49_07685 [Planctomycetales bacterium 71-10]
MFSPRRDRTGPRRKSAPARRRALILDVLEERIVLSGGPDGGGTPDGEFQTLDAPLAIDEVAFRNPVAGAGYQHQVTASGGTGSGYSFTATGLPDGLTMSASGLVSGTVGASAAGTYAVAVEVKDDGGGTASRPFAVTVSPAVAPVPAGAIGSFYTHRIEATGWTEGATFSAVGLPTGLTITTSGLISGTPTGPAGTSAVAVSAVDADGTRLTLGISFVVNPAIVFDASSPPRRPAVGSPYGYQVAASGGSGAGYAYEATGLPQGLAIDAATGKISGRATAGTVGGHSVVVKVTDDQKASATWAFTLTVNPAIVLASGAIPSPAVGSEYSRQVAIAGGSGSGYTFTATGLPPGLEISAGGLISGTPVAAGGPTAILVEVTDGEGAAASGTLQVTINPALGVSGLGTAPQGAIGAPYGHRLSGTGGSGFGYTFAATGLPPGLSLAAGGLISGTPTNRAGSPYLATITMTDAQGASVTRTLSLAINPALVLNGLPLPDGVAGRAYARSLAASGGSGSGYTFAATGLPAGLTMSAAGVISGTPTEAADAPSQVTITLTDGGGASITRAASILVNPTFVLQGAIPGPSLNYPYESQFTATGGAGGSYTFTATGLPPGLTMSASGLISGTVTTGPGARYAVVVTVTDAVGWELSRQYNVTVDPPVSVADDAPPATVGAPYSVRVAATGGRGSGYAFSATGLPDGLSIDAGGLISGQAAAGSEGTYEVVVTAVDPVGASGSATLSLVVAAAVLPTATPENPYAATLFGSNGTATGYTYAATGLPEGLTMTPDGTILGTPPPEAAGDYVVTVTVTRGGASTQVPYAMRVNPPLALTVEALPGTDYYAPYRLLVVGAGGSGSGYTFTATGLPSGMSLSPDGVLSGRPKVSSGVPYPIVVTITDGAGASVVRTYPLAVDSRPFATPGLVTLALSAQSVEAGSAVTFTATVTPPAGGGVPTGWVLFFDGTYDRNGDELLGSVVPVDGVATFTTAALAAGSHSIYAVFIDSPEYGRSDSARLPLVVTPAPTVTTPTPTPTAPTQAVPATPAVQVAAPAATAAAQPTAAAQAVPAPAASTPDPLAPAPAPARVSARLAARARATFARARQAVAARPTFRPAARVAARPMAAAARLAARLRAR